MKLKDLLSQVSSATVLGARKNSLDIKIQSITTSSQEIHPGALFVAIPGVKVDGHTYLPEVIERGGQVCVVEAPQKLPEGMIQIQVPNARLALSELANAFYGHPSKSMKMIGVTGTNGKTTTTYLCEALFNAAGYHPGVIGTVNYRYAGKIFPAPLTTPDPLVFQRILKEMKDHGVTHVISEVSSHALALHRVEGVEFDAAIFTNLTQDHLDFHHDLEDYFKAKCLLFQDILQKSKKSKKISVINTDDSYGKKLSGSLPSKKFTFSISDPKACVTVSSFQFDLKGIRAEMKTPVGNLSIKSPLIGKFNLSNICGAVAAGVFFEIPLSVIEKGIASVSSIPGRLERVEEKQNFLVLVDYAHTDDALKNVGQALQEIKKRKIITVFGCGGDRDRKKRPLMAKAAAHFSDMVIVTSDNPRTEEPQKIIEEIIVGLKEIAFQNYKVLCDRREAITEAIHLARACDIVLIAGKGHEDYQILGIQKIHFDDREVAKEVLCSIQKP